MGKPPSQRGVIGFWIHLWEGRASPLGWRMQCYFHFHLKWLWRFGSCLLRMCSGHLYVMFACVWHSRLIVSAIGCAV
jgi:hypothetical protein